jgi:hypothetical protein
VAEGERSKPAPTWLSVLPVVALVVFAALQIALAKTRDLTPWKGGGFGMFSTVDHPGVRYVRVFLENADGSTLFVPPSPHSVQERKRAASYPVESTMRALAESVILRARARGEDVVAARLEYGKRTFDADALTLRPEPIGVYRFGWAERD